jgi:hypothetical protein
VVRDDVVVVGELLMADCAHSGQLQHLAVAAVFASLPVIAVPDILVGDAEPTGAELPAVLAAAWKESPGRSRKAIYELGTIRWDRVS